MAKTKKNLMIPFTYFYENMLDYCNYYYSEGTTNSDTIIWDTKNNKRVSAPYQPSKTFGWEDRPNLNYEEQYEQYLKDLNDYETKVKNNEYISVESIVWKENFEFEDTLRLTGMSRGRSAANFNLKSETNAKDYNVFMTDMVYLFQNGEISKGIIKGKWTFVKRGQNYGIKLVIE
jgi:hypothetical protein